MARDLRNLDSDEVERLLDIKEEIKQLAEEAMQLVRGTSAEGRARGYWYSQLVMALDDDHGYMGSATYTLQSAIDELEVFADEDEDDSETKGFMDDEDLDVDEVPPRG